MASETKTYYTMKRILLIVMAGALFFLASGHDAGALRPVIKEGPEGRSINRSSGENALLPFCDQDDNKESPARRRSRFKGHWGGIEIGLNNYAVADYELNLPSEISFMELHSAKSRNVNLNFGQLSIGLARHAGFVTGIGLGWNNYMFSGDNNIEKDINGRIDILDPGAALRRSKFSTFFLKIPFLLEFQIPTDHQRLNISAGPVGAVKLGSFSVMEFENKDKIKSDDDFNLNIFRYGATARIGYENFNVYGTYYFTPLFKNNLGPGGIDLFPFEIGIAFSIDD